MNYQQFLASLISSLSEPMVVFLLIAILAGWRSGLRGGSFVSYGIYLLFILLLIFFARYRLMKSHHTNWDVSDRRKRVRLLVLLLGFSVLFFASLWMFGSVALMKLSLFIFSWLLGFFLITLKTKISGHVAVSTLAVFWFWPMAILLPFIGWSRVVLRRHTIAEAIGGFLYSLLWLRLAERFLMR